MGGSTIVKWNTPGKSEVERVWTGGRTAAKLCIAVYEGDHNLDLLDVCHESFSLGFIAC